MNDEAHTKFTDSYKTFWFDCSEYDEDHCLRRWSIKHFANVEATHALQWLSFLKKLFNELTFCWFAIATEFFWAITKKLIPLSKFFCVSSPKREVYIPNSLQLFECLWHLSWKGKIKHELWPDLIYVSKFFLRVFL